MSPQVSEQPEDGQLDANQAEQTTEVERNAVTETDEGVEPTTLGGGDDEAIGPDQDGQSQDQSGQDPSQQNFQNMDWNAANGFNPMMNMANGFNPMMNMMGQFLLTSHLAEPCH